MKRISEKQEKELIKNAKKVMENSYSPLTDFRTGTALLTDKGNIYTGCNVESVISGMGTCSERAAIYNAISKGEYNYKSIAITSQSKEPIKPCGMCLQFIAELSQVSNHDIEIIMAGGNGKIKRSSIKKMLPGAFGPEDMGLEIDKYRKY